MEKKERAAKPLEKSSYGQLTVLEVSHKDDNKAWIWRCLCSCGKERLTDSTALRLGFVTACSDCMKLGQLENSLIHGMTGKRIYGVWTNMKYRCNSPGHASYHRYGALGTRVCPRWMAAFDNFYIDMGDQPKGKPHLCRHDVTKDFSKENCFWSDTSDFSRQSNSIYGKKHKEEPCEEEFISFELKPTEVVVISKATEKTLEQALQSLQDLSSSKEKEGTALLEDAKFLKELIENAKKQIKK